MVIENSLNRNEMIKEEYWNMIKKKKKEEQDKNKNTGKFSRIFSPLKIF